MNAHKKILGSLVLATALFTGCGSTDTTTPADKQQVQETQSKVEEGKKVQLQKYLRENGDAYQSAAYSNDKKEILLVGIQDTTVTFYKFDATTLTLKEKFSFDNIDGQIGIKKAGSDGKYTIISHKDSDASDYIFDSINGELTKEKEYVLKDPKEIIQERLVEGTSIREFVYTPQKQGVAVLIQSDTGASSLFLYGLENPTNPLKEYMMTAGSPDDVIEDISMLGGGKLEYTIFSKAKIDGTKAVVVYDYFSKKQVSSRVIGETNYEDLEKRLLENFDGYDRAEVKTKINDILYLVEFEKDANSGEFTNTATYNKIIDISDMLEKKVLTQYLPGFSGKDKELIDSSNGIELDRQNHRLIYHVAAADNHHGRYDYVTGVDTRYYDYVNNEITKVLPVRINLPEGRSSSMVPFYSPDKRFIFTVTDVKYSNARDNFPNRLEMYDAQGNYLRDVYSKQMDFDASGYSYYNYILVDAVKFLGDGQMQFDEVLEERYSENSHKPQKAFTVVLDYLTPKVVSTSAVKLAVGTTDDVYHRYSIFTKNQENIVSIVPYFGGQYTTVMVYDKEGSETKELYRKQLHKYYLKNIELIDEDTVSFIQIETSDGKNIYETDKRFYFKVTLDWQTGELLSKVKTQKPAN